MCSAYTYAAAIKRSMCNNDVFIVNEAIKASEIQLLTTALLCRTDTRLLAVPMVKPPAEVVNNVDKNDELRRKTLELKLMDGKHNLYHRGICAKQAEPVCSSGI